MCALYDLNVCKCFFHCSYFVSGILFLQEFNSAGERDCDCHCEADFLTYTYINTHRYICMHTRIRHTYAQRTQTHNNTHTHTNTQEPHISIRAHIYKVLWSRILLFHFHRSRKISRMHAFYAFYAFYVVVGYFFRPGAMRRGMPSCTVQLAPS